MIQRCTQRIAWSGVPSRVCSRSISRDERAEPLAIARHERLALVGGERARRARLGGRGLGAALDLRAQPRDRLGDAGRVRVERVRALERVERGLGIEELRLVQLAEPRRGARRTRPRSARAARPSARARPRDRRGGRASASASISASTAAVCSGARAVARSRWASARCASPRSRVERRGGRAAPRRAPRRRAPDHALERLEQRRRRRRSRASAASRA